MTGNFLKFIGEWHKDNLHGIGKKEWNDGESHWGQYKHDNAEGYLTSKYSDERVEYLQHKNG